jgi:ClpP class serine protease
MRNLIKAINGSRPFLVDYQIAKDYLDVKAKQGFTDLLSQFFGETPKPYMTQGGSYIIPVVGMIGKGLSPMEAIGSVDVEKIDDQIDEALASNPARIIFNINSDGGSVDGVEELADKIRSLPVETIAFSSGSMNSSAFWIGSACTRVVVSPSSSIGSVGVYLTLLDMSAQAKASGLEVKVYKAGQYKGIGIPGTSTTPEQDDYLQKEVDALAETFKASVKMKRKLVQDSDLQGQSMTGKVAAQKGFATGLASSLKDLLAQVEGTQPKVTAPGLGVPTAKKK